MGLDFSHGLTIIDLLAAGWTFIELQLWHAVGLALELAGPSATDVLDAVAAEC